MAKKPYHKSTPIIDNVFTTLLKRGIEAGIIPARSKEARDWFRNKAKTINHVDDAALLKSDHRRYRGMVYPGRMYMFYYDPKHKETLPYYDTFPLIFVVDVQGSYFTGLNLHYLPPSYRVKLMDALYSLVNNNRYDETTKLRLSYQILKNASAFRFFRPAFKKYLKNHVRSRFVAIAPIEWDIALFLPTERFLKAPMTKVWTDSKNMIKYKRPR